MFSVVFPVFVSVTFCVELLPTFTLLNATDAGLIPNCASGAVPIPLSPKTNGDPGAVLVIETLPLSVPAVVGANETLNDAV